MINNDNNAKPKVVRRSSLKSKNLNIKPKPNPNTSEKKDGKRKSISWGQIDTFEFKEMKPTFQENEEIEKKQTEESDERHKKFIESRRRSIQNEFIPEKQMIKMSENLISEIFDEEMKLYVGDDDKEGNNSSSKEKNKSRESSRSKSGSGSCSCSRCSRSCSCSSCCSYCRKSDKESDKDKKDKKDKKNKKEKQNDKDSHKSEDKKEEDKSLKLKGKKEEKDIDSQKCEEIKVKGKNLKLKENKEEKISIKKNEESPKDNNKVNKPKKEEEKVTNIRVKLIADSDAKVRLISYKEARELNLDTVAYIVLNDGSVLVVRKEYKSKNEKYFCDSPLNYSYNNLSFYSNGAMNPNYSNFTNINNLSRPNITNQVIELPFKKMEFKQPSQVFYPKSNYTFNKSALTNDYDYPYFQVNSFNSNIPIKNNNKINIKLRKNPNSPSLKMNKNAQSFKYFSPKINLKSTNLKSNFSQSQSSLLNNLPRKFIQISPQRTQDNDNYRVIEAIPVYDSNNQVMNNLQANDKITDSQVYQNKEVTNFSRYNKYKNQRKQNLAYSKMIINDEENNCNFTDMN